MRVRIKPNARESKVGGWGGKEVLIRCSCAKKCLPPMTLIVWFQMLNCRCFETCLSTILTWPQNVFFSFFVRPCDSRTFLTALLNLPLNREGFLTGSSPHSSWLSPRSAGATCTMAKGDQSYLGETTDIGQQRCELVVPGPNAGSRRLAAQQQSKLPSADIVCRKTAAGHCFPLSTTEAFVTDAR